MWCKWPLSALNTALSDFSLIILLIIAKEVSNIGNASTNKGATIIITDLNEEKCLFGDDYYIEKYENNKWVKLKEKKENVVFPLIGYSVRSDNKLEKEINWEDIYGNLTKGKYRLVKTGSPKKNGEYLEDGYLYTEFTINDTNNLSLEEKLYQIVNPSEDYALLKYLYTNNNYISINFFYKHNVY